MNGTPSFRIRKALPSIWWMLPYFALLLLAAANLWTVSVPLVPPWQQTSDLVTRTLRLILQTWHLWLVVLVGYVAFGEGSATRRIGSFAKFLVGIAGLNVLLNLLAAGK